MTRRRSGATSTKVKGHPFEVVTEIDGMECAVLSDQVKSLDWKIRRAKKKAAVSAEVMLHVRAKMKALLQIPSGKAAHLDSVDRACPLCAPHLAEHSPASEHPLPRTSGAA